MAARRGEVYTATARHVDFAWLGAVARGVAESVQYYASTAPVVLRMLLSRRLGAPRQDGAVVDMASELLKAYAAIPQQPSTPPEPHLEACFSKCPSCPGGVPLQRGGADSDH